MSPWSVASVCLIGLALAVPYAGFAADTALEPPPIKTTPGPEYADSLRAFQGIPGIERAANGRLWATWYGGGKGEDRHNFIYDLGRTREKQILLATFTEEDVAKGECSSAKARQRVVVNQATGKISSK
jgi:hypothetical protein